MARKSRDFSGCWTCRQRKVKCDLQRPCCKRCQKAKMKCLGYKIKLGWAAPLTVVKNELIQTADESLDNFQRRNIDLVKFPPDQYYSTYKQLNAKLESLEKEGMLVTSVVKTVGPFGVFKLTLEVRTEDFESTLIHENLVDFAKLTTVAIKGIDYEFNQQNMLHILYPKFFPNLDSDDWLPNMSILNYLFLVDDKLHLFPLLNKLLDFDSSMFSFNRMVFSPNYYDYLVIPYLKQIFLEYFLWKFANSGSDKVSDIKLAIIYLTLSLSSFHKSTKSIELDMYMKLSVELRKIALDIINKHLDSYDDEEETGLNFEYEQALLLAILLQIEVDSCYSVYENFDLMFAIADNIIKNKLSKRLSNFIKFLVNLFKIWYIFFEATQSVNIFNYEIDEKDANINYRDLNENYDLADSSDENDEEDDEEETFKPTIKNLISNKPDYEPLSFSISFNKRDLTGYDEAAREEILPRVVAAKKVPNFELDGFFNLSTIYLMYGLPKSLLDLLHEITHLTNHKNIFKRKNVFPRNFPRICAETYDKLINWKISDYWELDLRNISHRQLHLYAESFHKALIVYFKKLIDEKNVSSYQDIIIESLNSLIELVEIKGDFKIKPIFFILFVCGADVLDKNWQLTIEKLWNLSDSFNCQFNHWRGKQILYEVWKRRDEGDDIGFMDVIREWDNVLFLG